MNENTNLIDEHNESLTPIVELSPFKKMVLSLGTLPSSFYNTMTYYESLVYFYEYLKNEVIPTVNNNGEAVEELQTKYLELKDYVDNYFENLDVQEEINNKLDEMTLDGTLTDLIANYVDPIYQTYEETINGEMTSFQNSITGQFNTFKGTVNSSIQEIDDKVESASSGSPKGTYSTVSDLTTADPDHDYIYVVTEDGKWYYYDTSTTTWTAGGTYLSNVDYDEFIEDYKNTPRRFNYNKIDMFQNVHMNINKTINAVVGTTTILNYNEALADNTNADISDPFRVRYDNGDLVFTSSDWTWDNKGTSAQLIWAFDKDGSFIRSYTGLTFDYTNIASDVYYLMVKQFHALQNSITLTTKAVEWLNIAEQEIKTYHVGTGQTYTSFYALLNDIQADTDEKIIYIHEGTYDIFTEMGGTTFINNLDTTKQWYEVNKFIPLNTKIIGIGNVVFNYLPAKTEVTEYSNKTISPINIRGNVEIENLTINCQYCRYGIHDETSNIADYNEMYHKYKNVNITYKNSDAISFPSGICFGCGFGKNERFEFDNCKFICERPSGGSIYLHNWGGSDTRGSVITFNNCVLKNLNANTSALQLGNMQTSTTDSAVNLVNVNSCYLLGKLNSINGSNVSGIKNTFKITCLYCNNPNITFENLTNDLTPEVYS